MQASAQPAPVSKKTSSAGIVISALPALFLLFGGVMKLVKPAFVVEATVRLGYPESVILGIGIVLIACTIIYVIPRTAVLGAILLTGYLGGAVATHVRAGDGPFPILFPVIMGALLWGGLFLRDERISEHLQSGIQTVSVSKKALWAGIIIGALPVLMLLFSGVLKLAKPAGFGVVEGFGRLGYSESVILGIGILELACTVVYIIPRTSVLGAILLTGYLGGAVATHVRVGDPFFFMPALLGALVWGGLYLRDVRLRALLPLRS